MARRSSVKNSRVTSPIRSRHYNRHVQLYVTAALCFLLSYTLISTPRSRPPAGQEPGAACRTSRSATPLARPFAFRHMGKTESNVNVLSTVLKTFPKNFRTKRRANSGLSAVRPRPPLHHARRRRRRRSSRCSALERSDPRGSAPQRSAASHVNACSTTLDLVLLFCTSHHVQKRRSTLRHLPTCVHVARRTTVPDGTRFRASDFGGRGVRVPDPTRDSRYPLIPIYRPCGDPTADEICGGRARGERGEWCDPIACAQNVPDSRISRTRAGYHLVPHGSPEH